MRVYVGHGEFSLSSCSGDQAGKPILPALCWGSEEKPAQDPSLLFQGPTRATWEIIGQSEASQSLGSGGLWLIGLVS